MSNSSSPLINPSDTIITEDGKRLQLLTTENSCSNLNHESMPHNQIYCPITNFDDLEIIASLFNEDIDISRLEVNSQTLLDISIEKNNEELVKLLLDKEAYVEKDFNELICNTIKIGNENIVKHLLDHGFQKNLTIDIKDCLEVAINEKHLKIIELLMSYCSVKKVLGISILKSVVLKDGQEYKECIDLLLKLGLSIDNRIKSHDVAFSAVQNGHTIIVGELLKLGINVNWENRKTKLTLLHVAVLYNHLDIAQMLIKHNADVNWIIVKKKWLEKNKKGFEKVTELGGKTALHIAVDNCNLPMTKLLLENGAKIVDDMNFFKITCNAIQNGSLEIVQLFLEYGVHINNTDAGGKTFLHFCATCKFQSSNVGCDIAEFLLGRGININAESSEKNTPIIHAIINNNTELVKIFLKYNANIQYANLEGDTPLHKAAEHMVDEEIVNVLLSHNAHVDVVNKKGYTPLHVACRKGSEAKLQTIENLLFFKANINCFDKNNRTPLHFACENGHVSMTQLLLKHGAAVNVIDNDGNTPLHLGCKNRNLQIVENLLKYQANPNIKNIYNKTPLLMMSGKLEEWLPNAIERLSQNERDFKHMETVIERHKKNLKIIQLLLEYRSDVNAVDNEGKSSLHIVAEKNYFMIVKVLLKFNINLNIIDNKGQTALHYAAENGNFSIVKSLLIHGADVNITSDQNKTALHHALIGITRKQKMLKNYLKDPKEISYDESVPADYKDENTESYQKKINSYKNIIIILKEHIIKLKCAKLNVDSKNMALAYNKITSLNVSEFDPWEFKSNCEKEIVSLKLTEIKGSDITFYDLLTQDILFLIKYANDKNIMKALLSDANRKMFPLYIDIITLRFMTSAQRYDLMEVAKKYSLPTIFQGLSYNCADEVLNYFDINELKNFIETVKSTNNFDQSNISKSLFSVGCQTSINE
ncbi:ankyrin-1-like [Chelonus insularis]|uniref:ankyrin-1-like n=1 Tax=Chelonus insularis TaxID=460826 RepID=UPI00158E9DA7|nr:ankyrin-1-like [Chelonus insularis]